MSLNFNNKTDAKRHFCSVAPFYRVYDKSILIETFRENIFFGNSS